MDRCCLSHRETLVAVTYARNCRGCSGSPVSPLENQGRRTGKTAAFATLSAKPWTWPTSKKDQILTYVPQDGLSPRGQQQLKTLRNLSKLHQQQMQTRVPANPHHIFWLPQQKIPKSRFVNICWNSVNQSTSIAPISWAPSPTNPQRSLRRRISQLVNRGDNFTGSLISESVQPDKNKKERSRSSSEKGTKRTTKKQKKEAQFPKPNTRALWELD